jgi:hypothetical protein
MTFSVQAKGPGDEDSIRFSYETQVLAHLGRLADKSAAKSAKPLLRGVGNQTRKRVCPLLAPRRRGFAFIAAVSTARRSESGKNDSYAYLNRIG